MRKVLFSTARARRIAVASAKLIRDAGMIEPCAKHFGEVALGCGFHRSPQFFMGHFASPASPHDPPESRAEIVAAAQILQRSEKQRGSVAGGNTLRARISRRRKIGRASCRERV